MSKKNSSVILKKGFQNFEDLSKEYSDFKKKFKSINKRYYVVAISGGPDSLALAALTKALSFEKNIKFYYVLIDHRIRKNSSKEANQVKNLLKKHKIFLHILKNKLNIKKNIQSNARKIRYNLLANFSKKKKVSTILTAHNLEDQVETFFIRLSRGSGITGLSGMRLLSKLDKNVILFRPLLNTKKNVLIKITKEIFGKYFKDPSNNSNKYLRTKIRGLKKPLNRSGINYDQIIKSINNLASSKETIDEYFKKTFSEVVKKSKKEVSLNLKKFNKINVDLKIRVINESIKIVKNNYYNPRSEKVMRLIKKIENKAFLKATLGGCIFTKKKDNLRIKPEEI